MRGRIRHCGWEVGSVVGCRSGVFGGEAVRLLSWELRIRMERMRSMHPSMRFFVERKVSARKVAPSGDWFRRRVDGRSVDLADSRWQVNCDRFAVMAV